MKLPLKTLHTGVCFPNFFSGFLPFIKKFLGGKMGDIFGKFFCSGRPINCTTIVVSLLFFPTPFLSKSKIFHHRRVCLPSYFACSITFNYHFLTWGNVKIFFQNNDILGLGIDVESRRQSGFVMLRNSCIPHADRCVLKIQEILELMMRF